MSITIVHIISGLGQGGAERNLAQLAMRSDRARFRHVVAPLKPGGVWEAELRDAGVTVAPLGLSSVADVFAARNRARALFAAETPQIVQSWLYHADLVAALSAPRGAALAWNIRNSDLSASGRQSWNLLTSALAALSRRPDVIVANARSALAAHEARGYRPRRAEIIPNGVDLDLFKPAPERRAEARARLGFAEDAFVIGMPARFDSFKDHATFFAAARIAREHGFPGAFALMGAGTESEAMRALARREGLADNVRLLGARDRMTDVYAALDLVTLTSSHGEGLPNVIAEAMACGRPVAATDVGDTAALVSAHGRIVAPRAPAALAEAWLKVAATSEPEREAAGARARAHIAASYSLDAMIARYAQLYSELAAGRSSNS